MAPFRIAAGDEGHLWLIMIVAFNNGSKVLVFDPITKQDWTRGSTKMREQGKIHGKDTVTMTTGKLIREHVAIGLKGKL